MNNIFKKIKNDFSIYRLFLSIFLSIITIITFLYCDSAKIKKDVVISLSNNYTYFDEISINGNTYLMSLMLNEDDDGNYYFDDEVYFKITNNDYIKVVADSYIVVTIDGVDQVLTYEDNSYTVQTSVDKYRTLINMFNESNKVLLILDIILFTLIYYLCISIIKLFFKYIYVNNRFKISLYILTFISLFIIYYFNFRTFVNIFGAFSTLIVGFTLLYFVIKYRKSNNFNYINNYLLIAIFIGISIMFINPPFNILDEGNHYSKVDSQFITKGELAYDDYGNILTNQSVELNNYINKYYINVFSRDYGESIIGSYEEYVTYESDDIINTSCGTALSNQLAYIPAMIMVHLVKLLHANLYLTFMLGRFINLLLFVLICYYAVKIIPKYKHLMFVICTFGVMLQQGMGINQDWLNDSLLVLLFSYIFNLIFEKKEMEVKDYSILCLIGTGLAFSKTIYTLYMLLILLIPNKKFNVELKNKVFNKALLRKGWILLFTFLVTVLAYKFSSLFYPNPYDVETVSESYSIAYCLSKPFWTFLMIFNCLKRYCHLFFFLEYFEYFGWYRIVYPMFITIIVGGIYLFLIFAGPKEEFKKKKDEWIFKIFNLILFGINSCMIAFSMLCGWTKQGADFIDGVQGRYFLPAVFTAYLFFNNGFIKIDKRKMEYICSYLVIIISLISLIYMISGYYC